MIMIRWYGAYWVLANGHGRYVCLPPSHFVAIVSIDVTSKLISLSAESYSILIFCELGFMTWIWISWKLYHINQLVKSYLNLTIGLEFKFFYNISVLKFDKKSFVIYYSYTRFESGLVDTLMFEYYMIQTKNCHFYYVSGFG